jgi:hypothetical protein
MIGARGRRGHWRRCPGPELAALGVEHRLEIDQPAAVALAGQQRGIAGRGRRRVAGTTGVRGRPAARPARLPRPAARSAPWPGRPRAPASSAACWARTWARRAPPSNTGSDTLASSALTTEAPSVSAPSVSALRPSEPPIWKFGMQRGIGLRHAGQGRAHLIFRGAHIGSLAQGLGGDAQARSPAACGTARLRPARPPGPPAAGRSAPPGHDRLARCWSARPATGACLFGQCAPARFPARCDQAGLQAPLCHLQGLQLAGQVVGRQSPAAPARRAA